MMGILQHHKLYDFTTEKGTRYPELSVSFQIFGKKLYSAPIVLVNHALTGNSDVVSEKKGWWKEIVGEGKLIDLNKYTVIALNIPGNGYDNIFFNNYKDFSVKDIAEIFYSVLAELNVQKLHAIIGGSLGGSIAWQIACLYPSFSEYIVPIASDWKATDWVIGHSAIQENILLNSKQPLEDARKMAMLFYRTPASFTQKFNRTKTEDKLQFNVESWLNHHGKKLNERYKLKAYLLMNHLLTTIRIEEDDLSQIQSKIVQIAVNSDLYYVADENIKTQKILNQKGIENEYYEIQSIHGHDAFLIEHQQITNFLQHVFLIIKK
ncbi:homoserine O-acetyltransferase [Balneicella halophila]|uniref:Homoserine O-acetyltransferase n=1 Tax=Balneicella halophila TaxID=1537566 RepID=A0A7L4US31_BALHA|nr:alpha/beta fold hydrolase [Balneicella halophila]PVX52292.1 homoserine O-acetyltransferase [Balneicella halophila]